MIISRRSLLVGAGASFASSKADAGFQLGVHGTIPPAAAGTTWDPANKGPSIVLSNGNLTAAMSAISVSNIARATIAKSSGDFIFGVNIDSLNSDGQIGVGFAKSTQSLNTYLGSGGGNSWGYFNIGQIYFNNSGAAFVDTFTMGDYIHAEFDGTNFKWFKNGTLVATQVPAAGTWFPAVSLYRNAGLLVQATANFAPTNPSGVTASPWA